MAIVEVNDGMMFAEDSQRSRIDRPAPDLRSETAHITYCSFQNAEEKPAISIYADISERYFEARRLNDQR